MYTYETLTHYPLIIASALALTDVLEDWRHDTIRIVAVESLLLILLCVLGYRLLRLIRERERAQIELRKAKTRLEKMNRSLEQLTLQDSLTGLGNRRLFDTALLDEFQRATREGTPLALLMIDVDYFKRYNDLYGHPAGDECLRQLGETLAESGCRPGDVAVRYGGEELAVLLPNTDEDGAFAIGERFRLAVLARAITHAGTPKLRSRSASVQPLAAQGRMGHPARHSSTQPTRRCTRLKGRDATRSVKSPEPHTSNPRSNKRKALAFRKERGLEKQFLLVGRRLFAKRDHLRMDLRETPAKSTGVTHVNVQSAFRPV
jgi:diguanylate cyclase (GGDEF)-like protein